MSLYLLCIEAIGLVPINWQEFLAFLDTPKNKKMWSNILSKKSNFHGKTYIPYSLIVDWLLHILESTAVYIFQHTFSLCIMNIVENQSL